MCCVYAQGIQALDASSAGLLRALNLYLRPPASYLVLLYATGQQLLNISRRQRRRQPLPLLQTAVRLKGWGSYSMKDAANCQPRMARKHWPGRPAPSSGVMRYISRTKDSKGHCQPEEQMPDYILLLVVLHDLFVL